MERLAVIGAGAWGTALATVLARNGRKVTLWAREAEVVEAVAQRRENPLFLPGIDLDPSLGATGDLAAAVRGAEGVLLAVPAQHLRGVAAALQPHLAAGTPILLCAKGIEEGTLALMTEVAGEALPEAPCAVLSGPTFAIEVARGLPTAVTVAAAVAVISLPKLFSLFI